MKKGAVSIVISIFLLGGCSKGHIDVNSENENQDPSNVQAQGQTQVSGEPSKASQVVFISFDADRLPQINPNGLGFSSTLAKTSLSYVFPFNSSAQALVNQTFTPWSDGVAFIKPIDPIRDAISFTQLPNLESEEIYTHTRHIISVSGSENFKKASQWLSWVDDQGEIYLWSSQTKNVVHLSIPSFKGTSTQLIARADRLLIMGQNLKNPTVPMSEILLFDLSEPPHAQREFLARVGALSPEGQFLALLEPTQAQESLTVQNLLRPEEKYTIGQFSPQSLFQLTWSANSSLAYWVKEGDRHAQIRVVEIGKQKSSTVADIQFPDAIQMEKIICPHWKGQALYYGGILNGKYSIFKAIKKSGAWHSSIFAKPTRDDDGYGCPKVSEGE